MDSFLTVPLSYVCFLIVVVNAIAIFVTVSRMVDLDVLLTVIFNR